MGIIVLAGAGGHASEVYDVLNENQDKKELFFYDETNLHQSHKNGCLVLTSIEEVQDNFRRVNFSFVLSVGNPLLRQKFYHLFNNIGGNFLNVVSYSASISNSCQSKMFDVMKYGFVSANTIIGKGSLINTGAQVHHDVQIGEFSEISPRAVLLGEAQIGAFCRIGANATILPKIRIGNNVVVGAGSVVTRNLPDNCMAAGVPATIKKTFA